MPDVNRELRSSSRQHLVFTGNPRDAKEEEVKNELSNSSAQMKRFDVLVKISDFVDPMEDIQPTIADETVYVERHYVIILAFLVNEIELREDCKHFQELREQPEDLFWGL